MSNSLYFLAHACPASVHAPTASAGPAFASPAADALEAATLYSPSKPATFFASWALAVATPGLMMAVSREWSVPGVHTDGSVPSSSSNSRVVAWTMALPLVG